MIEFVKPSVKKKKVNDNISDFIFEPLERGFGTTFGNSLRRVLMSSLPGAAITQIKVDGAQHEFSTVKGLKEDLLDVILNMKQMAVTSHSDEPVTLKLNVKGAKKVTAADITVPADVEIINKDLYLATLNKEGKLSMEITVERGRGYSTAEQNKRANAPIGTIFMDSIFSPVKSTSFTVENTRVGQRTDYDRLVLKLETNGSVNPEDALSMAAGIFNQHLEVLVDEATKEEGIFTAGEDVDDELMTKSVEDLDLSVRSNNCLKKAGIETLGQLTQTKKEDLMKIRNFGQKSIDEIEDKLNELGLGLAK